jgi:hypothetical protein
VDRLENEMFEKLLHKYEELLQDNSLQPAERARFEKMRDDVEDALVQDWLPSRPHRGASVMALAASSLFGLFTGSQVPPRGGMKLR